MPLSRRELGQYLGLTVETISRHFAEWKRQSIVAEKQGTLQILERDTLNEVVTSE
jgi:CRP/FNR family transcriptional regulator